jgi:hypothetical protein
MVDVPTACRHLRNAIIPRTLPGKAALRDSDPFPANSSSKKKISS